VTDGELEQIRRKVNEKGLGYYEVTGPQPGGADRWDVRFLGVLGRPVATGIPMDGRTSLENLLIDIGRVATGRNAVALDSARLKAVFQGWREQDQRRRG
jgi:hypothetical protein